MERKNAWTTYDEKDLQALEDVKTAEARLKDLLQEGGWLDE